jgi:formamidopyrimidine-DNA glycosylase
VPELPEVETVRRQLAAELPGRRFQSVEQVEPSMLRDCTEQDLRERLPGADVLSVDRMGKFLIVRLSGDGFLTFHLGMTGQILLHARDDRDSQGSTGDANAPGDPARGRSGGLLQLESACACTERHTHTRFLFELGSAEARPSLCLEFRDARKFGRVHLTFGALPERMRALGPDAWRGAWAEDYLASRLKGRRTPVKSFLLDQRNLAGIGNIYADEILWLARISPLRPGGTIGPRRVKRLATLIPERLGEGVELLGCSISDFVDTQGRSGGFQQTLRAYGRQGQKCSRCGKTMKRVVIAGRSSTYCPGCQR